MRRAPLNSDVGHIVMKRGRGGVDFEDLAAVAPGPGRVRRDLRVGPGSAIKQAQAIKVA